MNSCQRRIEYVDLAKGFCILLVVFRHVLLCYPVSFVFDKQFTTFRMPLYFVLSGLFFKSYSSFNDFLIRKTNKLLIPYFFFFLVTSCLIPFIFLITGYSMEHYKPFSIYTCFSFFTEVPYLNNPIWFLLCLFDINVLFYIIFYISNKIFKNNHIYIIIFFSFFIGAIGYVFGSYLHIDLPMYLDTSLTAIPFFCFGYVVKKHTSILYQNKLDKFIPFFIFVGSLFIYFFACDVRYVRNEYQDHSLFNIYSCGIVGTLIILLLSKMINHIPVISYFGRYSIIILTTHMFLITLFTKVFGIFTTDGWLSVSLVYLMTMSCYLIVIPFMLRYLPYFVAQKDVIKVKNYSSEHVNNK